MWLRQLALTNVRSYARLALELAPGVAVFRGRNGQGKSNLLEAVYVLGTTKSPRTSAEREVVRWPHLVPRIEGLATPPFARLEGRVQRGLVEVHLEVLFKGETPVEPGSAAGGVQGAITRSIKANGLPVRASEMIGQLAVVYFAPEDVALASGPPVGRRRYLDLANSQVAPLYLRALQQYNRILLQRNQVLRQLRERRQPPSALQPWNDQLVRTGVFILRQRARMLAAVGERATSVFRDLAGGAPRFEVVYRGTVAPSLDPALSGRALGDAYRARLEEVYPREVEQAVSLVGPHRDDFTFVLDEVDLNTYGSRGQQRLAVLALKLAEASWMQHETDELPVILLDDILSELDPEHRRYVVDYVAPGNTAGDREARRQVWITTTDLGVFPPEFLDAAQRFNVDAGTVLRA